jgi:hypothetical protein
MKIYEIDISTKQFTKLVKDLGSKAEYCENKGAETTYSLMFQLENGGILVVNRLDSQYKSGDE